MFWNSVLASGASYAGNARVPVVPQAERRIARNAARTAKARLRSSAWVKVNRRVVINSYSQPCKMNFSDTPMRPALITPIWN